MAIELAFFPYRGVAVEAGPPYIPRMHCIMKPDSAPKNPLRSRWSVALCAGLAALALAACGGDKPAAESGQVAAKVNDADITVHQVEHVLSRQAALAANPQGAQFALQSLIDQELAAQAAKRDRLDQDPAFVQAMEAARREWLARAYQDKVAGSLSGPGADDIDRYFNNHPSLFAQRRVYLVHDWTVAGSNDALAALESRLRAAGPGQVAEVLRASGLVKSNRITGRAAEDVPLNLVDKLAELKDGQYLWVPGNGDVHVIVVLHSVLEPLVGAPAQRAIGAFLQAERRREALRASSRSLRDAGKVELRGKFAQAAASAP